MSIKETLLNTLSGVGISKAVEIVEEFMKNDKFIINPTAWEHRENFFVLKFNIWNDRKTSVITAIELDDTVNKEIIVPSEYPIYPTGKFIFVDPSYMETSLQKYEHYNSQVLSIGEEPQSISIVFRLSNEVKLENTNIIFKSAQKIQTYNLKDLLIEIPTICEYVIKRGHDPQKHYEILDF